MFGAFRKKPIVIHLRLRVPHPGGERMSKIDIAPSSDVPSERLQFVAHEAGDGHVHIEVTFPGSTPRVLGTLKFLDYDDWDVLRRVLSPAGPPVTFVRYSRQVST